MSKVAILQSNYLPWRGYFDLIDDVDIFIFRDDVQYTKQDWRNRNRIKTAEGPAWISVPVFSKNQHTQAINATQISYERNWPERHLGAIRKSYSKATFFADYYEELSDILTKKYETIDCLNHDLIFWVCNKLSIKTSFLHTDKMNLPNISGADHKTASLIQILKKVEASEYISGPAAKDYIDESLFKEAGISLSYKAYNYKPYQQLHGDFIDGLSIIDLIMNCGEDSLKMLKSQ